MGPKKNHGLRTQQHADRITRLLREHHREELWYGALSETFDR
jgi:hypothetical protein